MTIELISEVPILHVESGEFRRALLYAGLGPHHLDQIEAHWYPPLRDLRDAVHRECEQRGDINGESFIAALGARDAQDSHWDWRVKSDSIMGSLSKRAFTLECDGCVQGVMVVDLVKRCRLPEYTGQHLVYVEYIASAPWNRPNFNPPRQYGGIGRVLMSTVISLSIEEGYEGRVGLHALPQADLFYGRKCGMTNIGCDKSYQGLAYFEFTPDDAHKFMQDIE